MKTRTYKGYEIRDWSDSCGQHPAYPQPKYFAQTQHSPTGMDWSYCPDFWSLKAAKEWINENIAADAAIALRSFPRPKTKGVRNAAPSP